MNEDSICLKCVHFVNGWSECPDNDGAPGYSVDYPPECGIGCDKNFGTDGGCYQYRGEENVLIDQLKKEFIRPVFDSNDYHFNRGIIRAIRIAGGADE